jgi:NADPH:quinone reductase-like Zn-dependent oxidoreductase
MKALQHIAHGSPEEALKLVDIETPTPGRADLLCRVLASPINPADLLSLRGLYPIKQPLPGIPGIEGVGVIEAKGSSIGKLEVGQKVLLPVRANPWAEKTVVKAMDCIPLSSDVDPVQVCMLQINALTARVLLSDFRMLSKGDWIIQNPGSSTVGQYIVQLAELRGIRTVNLIRRSERAGHLESLGADVVLLDGEDLAKRVDTATKGAEISLALDAMGGPATDRMASCLSRGGLVISYGAMSREPAQLSVVQTVFRGIRLRGFWLYPWKRKDMQRTRDWIRELGEDFEASRLITEVAGEYSLDQWREALELAESSERNGRVVFCPSQ